MLGNHSPTGASAVGESVSCVSPSCTGAGVPEPSGDPNGASAGAKDISTGDASGDSPWPIGSVTRPVTGEPKGDSAGANSAIGDATLSSFDVVSSGTGGVVSVSCSGSVSGAAVPDSSATGEVMGEPKGASAGANGASCGDSFDVVVPASCFGCSTGGVPTGAPATDDVVGEAGAKGAIGEKAWGAASSSVVNAPDEPTGAPSTFVSASETGANTGDARGDASGDKSEVPPRSPEVLYTCIPALPPAATVSPELDMATERPS
jgi:hypothetical protein